MRITRRQFTSEEDERITELRLAGASLAEIGKATDRHRATILRRLMWLAARDEENEAW